MFDVFESVKTRMDWLEVCEHLEKAGVKITAHPDGVTYFFQWTGGSVDKIYYDGIFPPEIRYE